MHVDPIRTASSTAPDSVFDFSTPLSIETAAAVADGIIQIAPAPHILAQCAASHDRLLACIAGSHHVYGVTTGFGPLANRLINPAEGVQLQQNLVYHLATGLGAPLDWARARAVCLARLTSILQGYSGASRATIDALTTLLNSDLAPSIPERGTVGASGDLTPLAHTVLAFQGRGSFIRRNGETLDGMTGLNALGLTPLDLQSRDGLALVNGTSAMTGIAVQNAAQATRLADWALTASAVLLEVLGGRAEAWSPILAEVRPHRGQQKATRRLNAALEQSAHVTRERLSARQIKTFEVEPIAGQDAYTLRCVPQVIGGVLDALQWHNDTVTVELNAVSDNPVFPKVGPDAAIHGGNFMGQQIALVSDALSMAVVVLGGLAERQIARLTDETLNRGLPAFLHRGATGLNSGLMGAQVTATATLAEMRCHGPASVQSISTNGANQDVVSMGTIAARLCARQLHGCSEILAILLIALAQAMDIKGETDDRPFSASGEALRRHIRPLSPQLDQDRALSTEIAAVATNIRSSTLVHPEC